MLPTIILCGGRGARLKPLTDTIPKALVPLNGKPCIQHIVELYIRKGHTRFVLSIGYQGELIVDFFRRNKFDAEFEFSDAGERASMLERLFKARTLIGDRAFVAYGDTLIDVNLECMRAAHAHSGAAITITTAAVRSPFGLVAFDDVNRVTSFEEKPMQSYYIGHMLMESSALQDVDPSLFGMQDGAGLVALFHRLAAQRRLSVFQYEGPQITFNTQQDLDQAERELIKFFTLQHRTTGAT